MGNRKQARETLTPTYSLVSRAMRERARIEAGRDRYGIPLRPTSFSSLVRRPAACRLRESGRIGRRVAKGLLKNKGVDLQKT